MKKDRKDRKWTFLRQLDLFGYEGPNRKSRRNRHQRYGMTQAEFLRRIHEQRESCAICARCTPGGRGTWPVDHVRGSDPIWVRGLLCRNCNTGIGLLMHDPLTLLKAVVYLLAKGDPELAGEPHVTLTARVSVSAPAVAIDGIPCCTYYWSLIPKLIEPIYRSLL